MDASTAPTERSHKRITSSYQSTGEMDASLWQNLPKCLVELVLSRLPIRSFCRFRAVCKHWNSLVQRRSFRHLFDQAPSTLWFFELCSNGVAQVYDNSVKKWYRIKRWEDKLLWEFDESWRTNAGLMWSYNVFRGEICVRNLVLGISRTIPYPGNLDVYDVDIHVLTDRARISYRVIVIWVDFPNESDIDNEKIAVYKSENDSWTQQVVGPAYDDVIERYGGAHALGKFYLIFFKNDREGGLVSFDMDREVCTRTRILFTGFPGNLLCRAYWNITTANPYTVYRASLLEWQNRIFMIGVTTDADEDTILEGVKTGESRNLASSLYIWEFHIDSQECVIFDKMSDEFFQRFFTQSMGVVSDEYNSLSIEISFWGCENLVMIVYATRLDLSDMDFTYTRSIKYMTYDFETRVWGEVDGIDYDDSEMPVDGHQLDNHPRTYQPHVRLGYEPRMSLLI